MHIHTYTWRIHIDAIIKMSEDFFKKNIPLTLFVKVVYVRGSWRLNKDCNILTSPAPLDIAVCCSRSPGLLNRGPNFLSSPSYIIVQSPTQSLEWHVWSSSSGNNCHAVHRSLSSGASVYECTMGFYLVPYCQPRPPTRILLITTIAMCHFLPVHHFGMACLAGLKVNIQQ